MHIDIIESFPKFIKKMILHDSVAAESECGRYFITPLLYILRIILLLIKRNWDQETVVRIGQIKEKSGCVSVIYEMCRSKSIITDGTEKQIIWKLEPFIMAGLTMFLHHNLYFTSSTLGETNRQSRVKIKIMFRCE